MQVELPGKTLVVPEDGVIRRWGVRSSRGELVLVVVRPRGNQASQIARSRPEFVTDSGVHLFPTNLAVERGDEVGLLTIPGSALGARAGVEGATTRRWIPNLAASRPADLEPGTGFDRELLVRVEYFPGGHQRRPRQITGTEATTLSPGRVRARRRLRFTRGDPVEVALVQLGERFVLDEFIDGRRVARIDVPDFRPSEEGRIIELEVYAEEAPLQLGVYIEFVNAESSRILDHFYAVHGREFLFIN